MRSVLRKGRDRRPVGPHRSNPTLNIRTAGPSIPTLHPKQGAFFALSLIAICATSSIAHAAKIGDMSETSWTEQALDFLSLEQPVVRTAVLGTLLIGFCCGVLGSFLVVRKLSYSVIPFPTRFYPAWLWDFSGMRPRILGQS